MLHWDGPGKAVRYEARQAGCRNGVCWTSALLGCCLVSRALLPASLQHHQEKVQPTNSRLPFSCRQCLSMPVEYVSLAWQ